MYIDEIYKLALQTQAASVNMLDDPEHKMSARSTIKVFFLSMRMAIRWERAGRYARRTLVIQQAIHDELTTAKLKNVINNHQ